MATRGGSRAGAGRPKGAKTVVTEEAIKRASKGEMPLEYMLRIMRDEAVEPERRDRMAVGAAAYVHAKPPQEVSGPGGGPITFEKIERVIRGNSRD